VKTRHLFDSNVLILYLGDALDAATITLLETSVENKTAAISVITRAETLAWSKHTASTLALATAFVDSFQNIQINTSIADEAARIRREQNVKLPDALIAATALTQQMTLVTANVKDFERIPFLDIFAV
jgi:predicted nucleic acid-binding protein